MSTYIQQAGRGYPSSTITSHVHRSEARLKKDSEPCHYFFLFWPAKLETEIRFLDSRVPITYRTASQLPAFVRGVLGNSC